MPLADYLLYGFFRTGESSDGARRGSSYGAYVPQRRIVQHIEVIGGSSSLPPLPSMHVPAELSAPRLPSELVTYILHLAALSLPPSPSRSARILELSTVDAASCRALLATLLLPRVTLYDEAQLHAFESSLSMRRKDPLEMRHMVSRCTHTLRIRRDVYPVVAGGSATPPSLWDDAISSSRFERRSTPVLRRVLAACESLQGLTLGVVPNALDPRWAGERGDLQSLRTAQRLVSVRANLRELVCLQSNYGGDINEALWLSPSPHCPCPWASLTRVQLHGPRFRFSAATARALATLPQLKDLALIMPALTAEQQQQSVSSAVLPDTPPLQLLITHTKSLRRLLLVAHSVGNYLGHIRTLGPAARGLSLPPFCAGCAELNTCETDDTPPAAPPSLTLQLLTVRPRSGSTSAHHPALVSQWLLERARDGTHWDFLPRGVGSGAGQHLSYELEEWELRAPVLPDPESDSDEEATQRTPCVQLDDSAQRCERCARAYARVCGERRAAARFASSCARERSAGRRRRDEVYKELLRSGLAREVEEVV